MLCIYCILSKEQVGYILCWSKEQVGYILCLSKEQVGYILCLSKEQVGYILYTELGSEKEGRRKDSLFTCID